MTITIYGPGDESDFPIVVELEDYKMLSWFIGALAPGSRVLLSKGTVNTETEIEILVKKTG